MLGVIQSLGVRVRGKLGLIRVSGAFSCAPRFHRFSLVVVRLRMVVVSTGLL